VRNFFRIKIYLKLNPFFCEGSSGLLLLAAAAEQKRKDEGGIITFIF